MNLERIKALLEKLQRLSKSSNVHEAALAASRMQEILLKYNLSLDDIELKEEEVDKVGDNLGGSSCEVVWRGDLYYSLALYNFCQSIRVNGQQRVVVFGKKHNIVVVHYMYESLSSTIWRLAKEAANIDGMELAGRYTYLNTFARGAVHEIDKRLKEAREQTVKVNTEARALVVVQDAIVKKAFDDVFPTDKQKFVKRSGDFDPMAWARGVMAGKKIGIHKGVEHQSTSGRIRDRK